MWGHLKEEPRSVGKPGDLRRCRLNSGALCGGLPSLETSRLPDNAYKNIVSGTVQRVQAEIGYVRAVTGDIRCLVYNTSFREVSRYSILLGGGEPRSLPSTMLWGDEIALGYRAQ